MTSLPRNISMIGFVALAGIVGFAGQVRTQQPAAPAAIPPPHFHHIHLNSVNPAAAVDYYLKAIPGTTKETVAGFDAVKTNNIYMSELGDVAIWRLTPLLVAPSIVHSFPPTPPSGCADVEGPPT